jgi:hypothetical protein
MSREDSLPVHVGTTLIDAVLELKEQVGELSGKIDGLNSTVGDLHGRVAQTMTRDECASLMAGHRHPRPTPEAPMPPPEGWWKRAQTRLGVIVTIVTLVALLGGAATWMVGAYQTIQRAEVALKKLDGGNR